MGLIYIPSSGAECWKDFLAKESHWKTGHSAKCLAYCWEAAAGWPREIQAILNSAPHHGLAELEPLLAIPEHQVRLPGGDRPSQNDLFILASNRDGLATITIEGKVSESFGPTLQEWSKDWSEGKKLRLKFLEQTLGRDFTSFPLLRYQLIHRLASAAIEAGRFHAKSAIMIIHSFSQTHQWHSDYVEFLRVFGTTTDVSKLVKVGTVRDIDLYCGWAVGDPQFLLV